MPGAPRFGATCRWTDASGKASCQRPPSRSPHVAGNTLELFGLPPHLPIAPMPPPLEQSSAASTARRRIQTASRPPRSLVQLAAPRRSPLQEVDTKFRREGGARIGPRTNSDLGDLEDLRISQLFTRDASTKLRLSRLWSHKVFTQVQLVAIKHRCQRRGD